jgi:hypothetical protein
MMSNYSRVETIIPTILIVILMILMISTILIVIYRYELIKILVFK